MDAPWADMFLMQLERLIADSDTHDGLDSPREDAEAILRLLLEDGSAAVSAVREHLDTGSDRYEPLLSLIQLYAGAVQALFEQDAIREACGLRSLFRSAPLTTRWLLREVVNCARAVLLLSSRGLDVQASVILRQAWEITARVMCLAHDSDLAAAYDRLSAQAMDQGLAAFHDRPRAEPLAETELRELDQHIRERLSPKRSFRLLSKLERDLTTTSAKSAEARFEAIYDELSGAAHAGAILASVSEECRHYGSEGLDDGESGPVEEGPWHFLDQSRNVFFLLHYVITLYPRIAFAGGIHEAFYLHWSEYRGPGSEMEDEYHLFVALSVLAELGPEYNEIVFGQL